MGSPSLGTEHLLLGMIHAQNWLAGWVLASLGIDLDMVRRSVQKRKGAE